MLTKLHKRPTLEYSAGTFGFNECEKLEIVEKATLKYIMGLLESTSSVFTYLESSLVILKF